MSDTLDTIRVRLELLQTQTKIILDAASSLQSQINDLSLSLNAADANSRSAEVTEYDSDDLAIPSPPSSPPRAKTQIQRNRTIIRSSRSSAAARHRAKMAREQSKYVLVPTRPGISSDNEVDSD